MNNGTNSLLLVALSMVLVVFRVIILGVSQRKGIQYKLYDSNFVGAHVWKTKLVLEDCMAHVPEVV